MTAQENFDRAVSVLQEVYALLNGAVQDDCEHGVSCLNKRAAERYLEGFPATSKAITTIRLLVEDLLDDLEAEYDSARTD